MKPYLSDPDLTLYQGDVLEVLRELESESVHCVVTSPAVFGGLRDYGTGSWEGGDPGCDHVREVRKHSEGCFGCGAPMEENTEGCRWCADRQLKRELRGTAAGRNYRDPPARPKETGRDPVTDAAANAAAFREECGKCGARRVDNQLGLEPTPEAYLESMVAVFREVRRVLRLDGSCWLNIGDSYAANTAGGWAGKFENAASRDGTPGHVPNAWQGRTATPVKHPTKPKDLCMIPARLALALQADGWWLRSQIVWSKPNPMPESVTDRPTTSHEFVYLLTRSPRYFFDQEAVREPQPTADPNHPGYRPAVMNGRSSPNVAGKGRLAIEADAKGPVTGITQKSLHPAGRNMRSVWEIATQPYPEAHFATYPEELVRRCILAGSSERGCCPECGAPWTRETEHDYTPSKKGLVGVQRDRREPEGRTDGTGHTGKPRLDKHVRTRGWHPLCNCASSQLLNPVPCTVLDPFCGSGTTALVARKHGRHTIGIELNPEYCELAARRLQQLSLLA